MWKDSVKRGKMCGLYLIQFHKEKKQIVCSTKSPVNLWHNVGFVFQLNWIRKDVEEILWKEILRIYVRISII